MPTPVGSLNPVPPAALPDGTIIPVVVEANPAESITGGSYGLTPQQLGAFAPASTVPGPANNLTATATTLPPGSPATATITGDSPSQQLVVGVPAGDPGPPGQQAELVTNPISADYTLSQTDDGTMLIVLNPVVITAPAAGTLASGTKVFVQNVSGGNVVFAGMVGTAGATRLLPSGTASVVAFSWPGGSAIKWTGDMVQ